MKDVSFLWERVKRELAALLLMVVVVVGGASLRRIWIVLLAAVVDGDLIAECPAPILGASQVVAALVEAAIEVRDRRRISFLLL